MMINNVIPTQAEDVNGDNTRLLLDVSESTGNIRNHFTLITNQDANSTQLLKDASRNLFNVRLNYEVR